MATLIEYLKHLYKEDKLGEAKYFAQDKDKKIWGYKKEPMFDEWEWLGPSSEPVAYQSILFPDWETCYSRDDVLKDVALFDTDLKDTTAPSTIKSTEKANTMNTSKMMNRFFRKVSDVVIGMDGKLAIRKDDALFNLVEGVVSENPFVEMSVDMPAFAVATPMAKIKEGDIVLNSAGAIMGWVTKKTPKTLKVIKPTGVESTMTPSKCDMMGQGQTLMVVQSMMGEGAIMNPMMLMAMQEDGEGSDMKDMMMMQMMMGQQPAEGGTANPMAAMLPMLMLSKGKSGDSMKDMMMMQMMMGGDQSAQGMPQMMQTMMMMEMLGKKN